MALPLEQPLLQRAEHSGVEPLPALARRLDEHVEVRQRDARGERRQLPGIVVREVRHGGGARRRGNECLPRLLVGQRHLNCRDVRVAGQPIAEVGEFLVDHHECHVEPLHVRAHRPVEHRHELRRGLHVQPAWLAGRKDVGGLIHDHREAQAILVRRHDVVANEPVEQREGCGRILGQGAEITHLPRREGDHVLEPLLVPSGEGAQSAPEVVVQHQRPAAEQLLREELRQHAVARFVVIDAKEIVGVAVQDERRRRAREVQIRQLRGPWRQPRRQVRRTPMQLRIKRHDEGPRADRSRGWPAAPATDRQARSGAAAH